MPVPPLRLHYLGHSSFVLLFGNGVSVLTDYGASNSYGLDSPIHDLGTFRPDVVLYSHHDPDHDRGERFPGARVVDGPALTKTVEIDEIDCEPLRTSETADGDNTSFAIGYEGLTILFAGDCQGDIDAIDQPARRARIEALFPSKIDLLLIPIDWMHPIAVKAAEFVDVLSPERVVPMHYWGPPAKAAFLSLLEQENSRGGKRFLIEELGRPNYAIDAPVTPVTVVSLEPAPYPNGPRTIDS
ncbi:MAG: MBL fold metallo-hydrolase [Gaiellaceae bacterium]